MAASGSRKGGLILIVIALFMILLLAIVGFVFRDRIIGLATGGGGDQGAGAPAPTQSQNMTNIVVLAQPTARGALIDQNMLTMVPYPQDEMVEGLFYTDPQTIIGLRTKFDLPQGIPLTPNLLTNQATGSDAAFQIPAGMVAVSIPVNKLQLVAYALEPGDHINIIASLLMLDIDTGFQSRLQNYTASVVAPGPSSTEGGAGPTTAAITIASGGVSSIQGRTELDPVLNQAVYVLPSEAQRPRLISQTVVQDATVLWVGDFPADGNIDTAQTSPTPTPEGGAETAETAAPRPDIITVVVTPQDAQTINFLLLSGANMSMALRSSGDSQRIPTEAVSLQFVMDQYGIPYPAKLPYGLEPPVLELPSNLPLTPSVEMPVQ